MATVETDTTDLALADVCAAEQLKAMIDDLGEGEVYAVTRYVLFLRSVDDSLSRSLEEAPLSDEEYILDNDDDWDDDDEPGRVYTQEEIERELGL